MWRAGGRYPVALVARMGWPRCPVAGGAGRVAAGRVGWWRHWWPLVAPVAGSWWPWAPMPAGWWLALVAGAARWPALVAAGAVGAALVARCPGAGAAARWRRRGPENRYKSTVCAAFLQNHVSSAVWG
jgi:hypothetical protein